MVLVAVTVHLDPDPLRLGFGTWKVLGKGKEMLRKMIFHGWFHREKYKRKSNVIRNYPHFTYF